MFAIQKKSVYFGRKGKGAGGEWKIEFLKLGTRDKEQRTRANYKGKHYF
jgi:hypothetical protein